MDTSVVLVMADYEYEAGPVTIDMSCIRIGKIDGVSARELRSILGSGDVSVPFSLK